MIKTNLTPEEIPDFDVDWRKLCRPSIKNHYPKFYETVNELYPDINDWMEKVWLFAHGMTEPPKLSVRGLPVFFYTYNKGYKDRYSSDLAWDEEVEDDCIIFTPEELAEIPWSLKTKKYLKNNHVSFYNFIKNLEFNDEVTKWMEKIYLYEHRMEGPPRCLNCGKRIKFVATGQDYDKYCCHECYIEHKNKYHRNLIYTPEEILELDGSRRDETNMKLTHPKFYEFIMSKNYPADNWWGKLYMYAHNLNKIPVCPVCGKVLRFKNFIDGYVPNCECIKTPPPPNPLLENYDESKKDTYPSRELIKSCKYWQIRWKTVVELYPKFCEYINKEYSKGRIWIERLYMYANNLDEPQRCKNCGEYTRFISFEKGYDEFCCKECRLEYNRFKPNLSILTPEEVLEMKHQSLRKNALSKNYPNTYEHIKEIYKDLDIGWLEKVYLYAHHMDEPPKCKRERCNNSVKFESFGSGHYKYCCTECADKCKEKQKRFIESKRQHIINTTPGLIGYTENKDWVYTCNHPGECVGEICKECDRTFYISQRTYNCRIQCGTEVCTKLNPVGQGKSGPSKLEMSYQDFLEDSWYRIIRDDREVLRGYELDILHIDYPLAIEINGSLWHSLEKKDGDKTYHKRKFFLSHTKGIEMITVWEDWDFDLSCQFIIDKTEGRSLDKYKKEWFPDLSDDEWPADMGLPPSNRKIIGYKEHECMHGGHLCYDCGVFILEPLKKSQKIIKESP